MLDDVSAEFKSGLIYAVVGRNGSGKTMLFRALSGLMKVDSGAVTLDGRRLHKDFEMLPGLGIMLENAGLYPDLSAVDNLSFLMGINKKPDIRIIKEYISRVVIRVSLVLQQAVRDVLAGLMQLQQDMAAVCREQQTLH